MLNENEANNLSYMEFKRMVIRILKELSENYHEFYGTHNTYRDVHQHKNT